MPGNCHSVKMLYYCKTGTTLALGIKELKYDKDVEDMLNDGYDNGNMIDLFVEHYDYDVIGLINLEPSLEQNIENSNCYSSDDAEEEIDDVDFQTEGDDSVVIKDITTSDPFLNKLCSIRALFRGSRQQKVSDIDDIKEDLNNDQIDPLHKVKKGVVYPAFDPNIPWDKMEPVLGTRYESAHQLKLALTNYGVAHGYQLWYMKNDWRSVLVYCGRNVAEGRCAGKKGNKNRVMPNKDRSGVGNGERCRNKLRKSRGELLTAMGRDANNQMYPIAWDVALLSYQILISTIEQQFQEHMEQIKLLDPLAYDYLVQRDPNTWSRAFFEMDRRCATFENGISKSFNRAILGPRSKAIITMLEEIRLYIMQRLFAMNKIAVNLEDSITPSIRKRLEVLNEKQRYWFVFSSGFQELEVRNGDESYGVNLQHKFSIKHVTGSRPKPGITKPHGIKRQPVTGETASRGGLGSRGGRKGGSGGRGRGGGNSSRDGGNSSRECGSGTTRLWQEEECEARNDYLNEMHWMEEETHEAVIEESHQDVIEETHEAVDEGKALVRAKLLVKSLMTPLNKQKLIRAKLLMTPLNKEKVTARKETGRSSSNKHM
ncbi:hypothetical protein Tco_1295434 [Tanacetum coccineum]